MKLRGNADAVKAVARVLKERFPNLTVNETIDLAFEIIRAIPEEES